MPDHSWSLTLALCSIAHRAGYEIAPDDLHAALGLSVLVCAVPTERRLALWPTYARDVFLTRSARAFGMTLRAVHPPEAARGLNCADEFRQHFDASYRPLIERAIENSQPVLAWQGWPGDHGNAWGIITRRCDDGVGFAGTIISASSRRVGSPPTRNGATACGSDSGEVTLTKPPLQLYVAERVTPTAPSSEDVLTLALDHALSVLNNEPGERFGVMTGSAAFGAWIARLRQSETGETGSVGATDGLPASAFRSAEDLAADHGLLAASVVAGHRAMLRFLQHYRGVELGEGVAPRKGVAPVSNRCGRWRAGADRAELIDTLTSTCELLASELATPTDLAAKRRLTDPSADRAELTDHLAQAREACEKMRNALASYRPSNNA